MPVTGIKELIVRSAPKELDTTGEEVDVVEHLRFLMGKFVNAYLPANGLDIGEVTEQGEALYLIMTDSQFSYLDVDIGRLGEESDIRLIVTVIFEEIDLLISHFHFTVIEVYTSFIYDDQTIFHKIPTYIILDDLVSTTNRKVTIHSTARSQSLFCKFCSVCRFTAARKAKIQINTGIIRFNRAIDEAPKILVIAPLDEVGNIHNDLRSIGEKARGCIRTPPRFFLYTR